MGYVLKKGVWMKNISSAEEQPWAFVLHERMCWLPTDYHNIYSRWGHFPQFLTYIITSYMLYMIYVKHNTRTTSVYPLLTNIQVLVLDCVFCLKISLKPIHISREPIQNKSWSWTYFRTHLWKYVFFLYTAQK